jgi:predicted enzyme related to lactoylglutathione lyase
MSNKIGADTNALNWFEIPVNNITRATKFYETILEIKTVPMEMMGMKMAMFPTASASGKVGGALVQSEMHTPSTTGSVIYLNANPNLDLVANRIEKAGGKVAMPKTLIDENSGYMAFFTDTEGNSVGLHSTQ